MESSLKMSGLVIYIYIHTGIQKSTPTKILVRVVQIFNTFGDLKQALHKWKQAHSAILHCRPSSTAMLDKDGTCILIFRLIPRAVLGLSISHSQTFTELSLKQCWVLASLCCVGWWIVSMLRYQTLRGSEVTTLDLSFYYFYFYFYCCCFVFFFYCVIHLGVRQCLSFQILSTKLQQP